jgi:protein arginine kinase activator
MKCQFCPNPATLHLTDIIQRQKHETHLCDACARQRDLIADGEAVSVTAVIEFLVSQSREEKKKQALEATECPCCGLKYAQFRAHGRLGCPAEYDAFREALEPLLERIHQNRRHQGKSPLRRGGSSVADRLAGLRKRQEAAVRDERFEEAARLRDLIRGLE